MRWLLLLPSLCLAGCLSHTPPAPNPLELDQLLRTGLSELLGNTPPRALENLREKFPHTEQATIAQQLLLWKQQQTSSSAPQAATPPVMPPHKTTASESELRELKEENRRLRNDLEQLRRLLVESERRAR